jgi:hypothetical protein
MVEALPGYALPVGLVGPGDGGVDAGDGIVGGVLAAVLDEEFVEVEGVEEELEFVARASCWVKYALRSFLFCLTRSFLI